MHTAHQRVSSPCLHSIVSPFSRVDLHDRQGQGDGHGGVEALGKPDGDDQDASRGKPLEAAGVFRWHRIIPCHPPGR